MASSHSKADSVPRSRGLRAMGLFLCASLSAFAQAPSELSTADAPEGPFIEEPVFEGVGFAWVRFDDSAEEVETLMGEAHGGSATSRKYPDSHIEVRLYQGKVSGFVFDSGFRGMLATSELQIGDFLEDVEYAYGDILSERAVNELTDWALDRTLLVRRDGPDSANGSVLKLCYDDVGLCVLFDDQHRINGFELTRRTGYATRALPDLEELADVYDGPYIEKTVFEGIGFADVKFEDSMDRVIELMDEPSCGSDSTFSYSDSAVWVRQRGGRVSGFRFSLDFRGTLSESGLGIGDSLDDVIASYGDILEEREVEDPSRWWLDRTLVVQRDDPTGGDQKSAKLYYRGAGLAFYFDDHDQISAFSIYPESSTLAARRPNSAGVANYDGGQRMFEELGLDGIRFGDSPERIAELLGEPTSKSGNFNRYSTSGMSVYCRSGGVSAVLFGNTSQTPLPLTELRIGDMRQDVHDAYEELRLNRVDDAGTDRATEPGILRVTTMSDDRFGGQLRVEFEGETLMVVFDLQDRVSRFRVFRSRPPNRR